jgi:hypothetical protein
MSKLSMLCTASRDYSSSAHLLISKWSTWQIQQLFFPCDWSDIPSTSSDGCLHIVAKSSGIHMRTTWATYHEDRIWFRNMNRTGGVLMEKNESWRSNQTIPDNGTIDPLIAWVFIRRFAYCFTILMRLFWMGIWTHEKTTWDWDYSQVSVNSRQFIHCVSFIWNQSVWGSFDKTWDTAILC